MERTAEVCRRVVVLSLVAELACALLTASSVAVSSQTRRPQGRVQLRGHWLGVVIRTSFDSPCR